MSTENKKFEARLITLGDGQVGKTSLILRYIDNKFSYNYLSTIGFDSKVKKVQLENGEEIKVKIFDTAGQERFKSIAKNYLKNANGIILAYDITREKTLENIQNWIDEMLEDNHNEIHKILIGNKSDLKEKRKISKEQGEEMAKQFELENNFYETSCESGENVEKAFNDLVMQVYEKYASKIQKTNIKIQKEDINEKNKNNDSKCCLHKIKSNTNQ